MAFVSGNPIVVGGVTHFPRTREEHHEIVENHEKKMLAHEKKMLAMMFATYFDALEAQVNVKCKGKNYSFRCAVPSKFFGEYVSPPIRPLTDIMGTYTVTFAGIIFTNYLYDITGETVQVWETLSAPSSVVSAEDEKVAAEKAAAEKAAAERAAAERAAAEKAAAERAAAEKAAAEKAAAEKAAAERAAAEVVFLAMLERLTEALSEEALDEAVSEVANEVQYLQELEREEAEKRMTKMIAKEKRVEEEKNAEIAATVTVVLEFILKKVYDQAEKFEKKKKEREKKAAAAKAKKERDDAEKAAFEEAKAANAALAAAAPSPVAAAAPSPVAAAAPSPVAADRPIVTIATEKYLKIYDTKKEILKATLALSRGSKARGDLEEEFRRLTEERSAYTNLFRIVIGSDETGAAYAIFVENILLLNGEEIEMFTLTIRKCQLESKKIETPPEDFLRLFAASVTIYAKNLKTADQAENLKIGGWISAVSILVFETKKTFRVEEAFYAFARDIVALLQPCRQTCFAEISCECLNFLDKIFDAK